MSEIRKLSDKVISLISAGEVITRPYSVIKELIENSIDSLATKIDIWVENGGKNLIIVKDNGNGMSYNDLKICIQNHTTSKLRKGINNIDTFGFRGEALASIAAVGKITITSKKNKEKNAYKLSKDDIYGVKIQNAFLKQGTKIEVRDLFYTLPVRLKFLKSSKTESIKLLNIIKQFALSHPDINFSCHIDGKEIIKTTTLARENNLNVTSKEEDLFDKLIHRASEIFSKQMVHNCLRLNIENQVSKVVGLIGIPTYNSMTRNMQFFFVNGRPIKDMVFYSAIKLGYADTIPHNKHAIAIIFLKIDPSYVDVNVHPTKSEVHFRDPTLLVSLISEAIKIKIKSDKHLQLNEDVTNKYHQTNNIYHRDYEMKKNSSHNYLSDRDQIDYRNLNLKKENELEINSHNTEVKEQNDLFNLIPNVKTHDINSQYICYPLGSAFFQFNNTFILSCTNDSIFFTDQHAAHERIVYEDLKSQVKDKKFLLKQKLLTPLEICFDNEEVFLAMEENLDNVKKAGFTIDIKEPLKVYVIEIPYLFERTDIKDIIYKLALDFLNINKEKSVTNALDYILKTFACHNSIRANKKLNIEEMNALLRKIETTQNSGQCNHGRPTYIKFNKKQIFNWFERT